ncbi:MAG: DUF1552 domain-containing protein [Planctomycetota bacterium]|nr:DUF1552 domain-containing protein [Planctomycetota bacterium]
MNTINRRQFAIRSCAGTLAIPMLASLSGDARAAGVVCASTQVSGPSPRRFVAVANLLGFQQKHFFPETEGRGFEKTPLLEPLWANRDQVTVYRGLDHGLRGGHFAVHSFLSGVLHHESKNRKNGNVTVDQLIADEIGRHTRFPSLTVGSEGGIHGGCQLSWTRSGIRVPPITGPSALFDKLFKTDSAANRARKSDENRLQASILDSVTRQAGRLAKRVNREDQSKLQEYLDSIRDVEKRLESRDRWVDQPKPQPTLERPTDRNTVEDLPLLYELMALALQTDSTRVATLEIGGSFLPQHLGINKSYHSMSHHGNKEETVANLVKLEKYQVKHFAKFLSRLSEIREGEQSLLESTAVLFGSGMGNANSHTNTDLPIVLAGGGYSGGQFKRVSSRGAGKVPLCNLLLDMAQKTGVQTESFGISTGTYS